MNAEIELHQPDDGHVVGVVQVLGGSVEGERPYMVVSEIPGKGTWYRVRVGDYASAKDALAAKLSFEKKHSVIAYVAQK